MIRVYGLLLLAFSSSFLAAAADTTSCSFKDIAVAGQRVAVLCEEDQVFVSDDQAATWQPKPLPPDTKYRGIDFLDAKRGFVIGDKGIMLATEDGGNTWRPAKVPTAENLMDLRFVGEQGWIAGFAGVVLHSADGGRTWAKQDTGVTQTLESIYFTDPNNGWAVGWIGTVIRTTDGGKTWQKVPMSAMAWSMSSVYFRDAKDGWIVGFAGQLLRSRDGGVTWQTQESPFSGWMSSVIFDSAGRGWIAAGNDFLISEDRGETWKLVDVPGTYFLTKLLRVSDAVWALGQFGVMRQSGAGKEWKLIDNILPKAS